MSSRVGWFDRKRFCINGYPMNWNLQLKFISPEWARVDGGFELVPLVEILRLLVQNPWKSNCDKMYASIWQSPQFIIKMFDMAIKHLHWVYSQTSSSTHWSGRYTPNNNTRKWALFIRSLLKFKVKQSLFFFIWFKLFK